MTAVEKAKDGRRTRSALFSKLPSKRDYPDYYELITTPIDLQTIKMRVKSGTTYRTWVAFRADMGLMFGNAKLYNSEDSEIYVDAEELEKIFLVFGPAVEAGAADANPNAGPKDVRNETKRETVKRLRKDLDRTFEEQREQIGFVRRDSLGRDRSGRTYWIVGEKSPQLYVAPPPRDWPVVEGAAAVENTCLTVTTVEELEGLIGSLLSGSKRESQLLEALREKRKVLVAAMSSPEAGEAMVEVDPVLSKAAQRNFQLAANATIDQTRWGAKDIIETTSRATDRLKQAGKKQFAAYDAKTVEYEMHIGVRGPAEVAPPGEVKLETPAELKPAADEEAEVKADKPEGEAEVKSEDTPEAEVKSESSLEAPAADIDTAPAPPSDESGAPLERVDQPPAPVKDESAMDVEESKPDDESSSIVPSTASDNAGGEMPDITEDGAGSVGVPLVDQEAIDHYNKLTPATGRLLRLKQEMIEMEHAICPDAMELEATQRSPGSVHSVCRAPVTSVSSLAMVSATS